MRKRFFDFSFLSGRKIKKYFFIKKKKAMEMEMIGWWLIALAVLVVVFFVIITFKEKGESAIDFLKNLFRLRR